MDCVGSEPAVASMTGDIAILPRRLVCRLV